MSEIVELVDTTHADRSVVGGKAHGLGRLIELGFRVPDGFVVTPDTPTDKLPGHLEGRLKALEGPLAYRSSAVAEDLAQASYAGQYDTELGVEGLDAGIEAIGRVRSSAMSAAVSEYRDRQHTTESRVAVIIQQQIDPRVSGVAFTRNPVTGADEVVIEAVPGLGEALMAGEVTPERWHAASKPILVHAQGDPALSVDEAREIADLCRRIEAGFGSPQDIEWAIDDSGVWLLQSRPITALPLEPKERPPAKQRWERADAFFPEPVTQLGFSAWLPTHTRATGEALSRFGVPSDGIDHGLYWGRVYDRLLPPGNPKTDTGGPPPAPILKAVVRVRPLFRKATKRATAAVANDLPIQLIDAWENGGRDRLRLRTKELREIELRVASASGRCRRRTR